MLGRPALQVRDGLTTHAQLARKLRLGNLDPSPSPRHSQAQLKGLQEPLCSYRYLGHGCHLYYASVGDISGFGPEMGAIGDSPGFACRPENGHPVR